jgi:hypothetical protein
MSKDHEQSQYYISNYILNSILTRKLDEKPHVYILNHLRRSEAAFDEYQNAKKTLEPFAKLAQ